MKNWHPLTANVSPAFGFSANMGQGLCVGVVGEVIRQVVFSMG